MGPQESLFYFPNTFESFLNNYRETQWGPTWSLVIEALDPKVNEVEFQPTTSTQKPYIDGQTRRVIPPKSTVYWRLIKDSFKFREAFIKGLASSPWRQDTTVHELVIPGSRWLKNDEAPNEFSKSEGDGNQT